MRKYIIIMFVALFLGGLVSCGKEAKPSKNDAAENHEHVFEEKIVEPSCTDGYTIYQCKKCVYSYTDQYVKALGHTYIEHTTDTKCTEYKEHVYICEVCKYSYTDQSNEKGSKHQYLSVLIPPTREESGYTKHTCKRCGDTYTDAYKAPVDYSVGLSYLKMGNGYYLSGLGSCTDTDVIVPHVNEMEQVVVGILEGALHGEDIVSVTVKEGIKDIKSGAFSECNDLVSIVLPSDADPEIAVFDHLPVLAELTMPFKKPISYYFSAFSDYSAEYFVLDQRASAYASAESGSSVLPLALTHVEAVGNICDAAFYNCEKLSSIKIHEGIVSIGKGAFECAGIEEIVFPTSLQMIENNAFNGCESLCKVTFCEGVIDIGENAFSYTGITEFVAPSTLKKINGSFGNCLSLRRVDLSGCMLTKIGNNSFRQCALLEEVLLPQDLVAIGNFAFLNCGNLSKLVLPDGLQSIGLYALANCRKLSYDVIPTALTYIGTCALKGVRVDTVYYTSEMGEDISFCESEIKHLIVEEGVTTLPLSLCSGCVLLEKVELPASLKNIGDRAFWGCSNLKEIDLPQGLETIGHSSFSGCGIVNMELPNSIEDIGADAFRSCAFLEIVVLPENQRILYSGTFYDCTSLVSIVLGNEIKIIGQNVFYNTPVLTECIYTGTVAQWNMIEGLSNFPKTCKVTCIDGVIEAE